MSKDWFCEDSEKEVKISRVKLVRYGGWYYVYALEEGKNRFFFWNWHKVDLFPFRRDAIFLANRLLTSGSYEKKLPYPKKIEIAVRGKSE